MKKVTLILSALALVLGLSQCKKQETPTQSSEKQHIVLTANNGNNSSKVSGSFESAALYLTWEGNETIEVSGGASGTLLFISGAGTAYATFEGNITIDRGEEIVFTVGDTPESFAGQTGTAEACATWIKENNHFVGTSAYQPSGSYEVEMKLQYAVLKLDVSALGTTGEMTIAAGGATVASVTDVTSSAGKAVFVAVPADGESTEYTISCGGKTATENWPLEPNVFYTAIDEDGNPTGEAFVIEPDAPAHEYVDLGLPSGLLWATCNVGANTPEEYGDYFMWGSIIPNTNDNCCWANTPFNDGSSSFNASYFSGVRSTVCPGDILASEYDAAAQIWKDGCRMPTQADWQELYDNCNWEWYRDELEGSGGYKVTNRSDPTKFIILPAAGKRYEEDDGMGFDGRCWSSSLYLSSPPNAYYLEFDYYNDVHPDYQCLRYVGMPVRPVRSATK